MSTNIKIAAVVVGAVAVAIFLFTYELALWHECLAGNPWWYCLRLLSR